jgi:TolA-binding protein
MSKLVSLFLLILLASCIKTAEQVQRERRVDTISEQMSDSQGLIAEMVSQLKDMQGQLDKMNGRLEELEHRNREMKPDSLKEMSESVALLKTQRVTDAQQLTQIQNELKEQRGFLEKVIAGLGSMKGAKTSAPVPQKKSPKDELYDGLELIKDNKFTEAREILEPLIDHKDLSLGDKNKVFHGLGKVEFSSKNYDKALIYFSKVYTKYPKSSIAPSSLLYIARSLEKMSKKQEAQEAFAKLIEDYPETKEAGEAKKEL